MLGRYRELIRQGCDPRLLDFAACPHGKGGDAPPAPDYTGAALATAAGNKEAAIAGTEANRVNQITPYGSLTYSQTGTSANGNPLWTSTQTLSPDQQRLLDLQNQTSLGLGQTMSKGLGYVQGMLDTPFNVGGLPSAGNMPTVSGNVAMPTVQNTPSREVVSQTLMDRQQPMFDRIRTQKENDLKIRGFNPGGEAWKSSQDDLARSENDARMAAILAGGTEQSRLAGIDAQKFGQEAQVANMQTAQNQQRFGQESQLFGLGQTAREKALQEQSFLRNEPLNTLNAVRTGAQVTGPQFQNAPQQQGYAGADMLGATQATGQYNQGTYNAQQANDASTKAALASAAMMMMSDRRLKRNIVRIGTHALGIGLYAWEYLWGERAVGVMADELEKVMPEAVAIHPSGFKMVNYSMIGA